LGIVSVLLVCSFLWAFNLVILLNHLPFFVTTNVKSAEHPELYKDRSVQDDGAGSKQNETGADAAGQRQAATDQFMLERFRKRERHRVMRR
jgi:hypothetical protein